MDSSFCLAKFTDYIMAKMKGGLTMLKSNNKSPVMFEINYCYDPITGCRQCILERKVDGCHSMKTINNITGFVLGKLLNRQFKN